MASLAGCIAAWLFGAAIAGVIDRRRGFMWTGAFAAVALAALFVLFT
jgi:hypothetical protein